MRGRARLLASALVVSSLAAGCGGATGLPDLTISLVDANGANPLGTNGIDRVRVLYRTSESSGFDEVEGKVTSGTFDVVVPVGGYTNEHELRFELYAGTSLVSLGASPPFSPISSTVLRTVVAPPRSCVPLALPGLGGGDRIDLPRPRKDATAQFLFGYVLLFGGSDATGPTPKVDLLDALVMTSAAYPAWDLATAPGRTRVANVWPTEALVISENDAPFVFDLYKPYRTPITLHAGAGYSSAVVPMGTAAAAVVGGTDAGTPVRDVTFVSFASRVNDVPTFTTSHATLASATSARAVTATPTTVWVASHVGGDLTFESLVRGDATSTVLAPAVADGVRDGALLFTSTTTGAALLLGGMDAGGTVRTDSVWIHGCPAACVVEAGPSWPTARTGVASDPGGVIAGGDGPSALVERVTFDGAGAPHLDALGTLATPRRAPGLTVLPSGVVYVLGGEGAAGPLDDLEQCVPPSF